MTRLSVTKTPKCYVGGAFIRSESGRVRAWADVDGNFFANFPLCSRKDVRNAVEAAAKAGNSWSARSGYNRGQILYRFAEMLEPRTGEMAQAIALSGYSHDDAIREVNSAIERIVHYAGWTDKYQSLLGSVNPVASSHFNFTTTESLGIVGIIAADESPLLGLISLILPVIASGNSVVALASQEHPYPAILLGEMLATSDVPGGVVNIITGDRSEMIETFATHEHIRGISAVVPVQDQITLEQGAASSVKRVKCYTVTDWHSEDAQGLYWIRDFVESKTIWHPIEN